MTLDRTDNRTMNTNEARMRIDTLRNDAAWLRIELRKPARNRDADLIRDLLLQITGDAACIADALNIEL